MAEQKDKRKLSESEKEASEEEEKKPVFVDKPGSKTIFVSENELKRITVKKWNKKVYVDFRKFWKPEGETVAPTKQGVSWSIEEWKEVKKHINDIDKAIEEFL